MENEDRVNKPRHYEEYPLEYIWHQMQIVLSASESIFKDQWQQHFRLVLYCRFS